MAERLLSGNDYSVALSKQTAKEAIDANPVFDALRRTDGKARVNTSYVQSTEVKTNRQARQNVEDSVNYAADVSFEFSEQTVPYLQDAIQGVETPVAVIGNTQEATATGFEDPSNLSFADMAEGDYFFASGFPDVENNIAYRITVWTDGGTVETSPIPPTPYVPGGGAPLVTFTSNRTTSGSTIPYYTVQTRVTDQAAVGGIDYQTFFDSVFNNASFEIGETGIITGSFAIVAEEKVTGNLLISGQTDSTLDDSEVLSAINNVVKIWIDGVDSDCTAKSAGFDFSNNLQEDKAAACQGSKYANGDMSLSGSLSSRLNIDNSQVWRDRYNAGTYVAIALELDHGNGNSTIVEIPRAVITEHEIPDGSNVVANSEMTYTAEEDSRGFTTVIYRNW